MCMHGKQIYLMTTVALDETIFQLLHVIGADSYKHKVLLHNALVDPKYILSCFVQ